MATETHIHATQVEAKDSTGLDGLVSNTLLNNNNEPANSLMAVRLSTGY